MLPVPSGAAMLSVLVRNNVITKINAAVLRQDKVIENITQATSARLSLQL
jgi:hypothetical protein